MKKGGSSNVMGGGSGSAPPEGVVVPTAPEKTEPMDDLFTGAHTIHNHCLTGEKKTYVTPPAEHGIKVLKMLDMNFKRKRQNDLDDVIMEPVESDAIPNKHHCQSARANRVPLRQGELCGH